MPHISDDIGMAGFLRFYANLDVPSALIDSCPDPMLLIDYKRIDHEGNQEFLELIKKGIHERSTLNITIPTFAAMKSESTCGGGCSSRGIRYGSGFPIQLAVVHFNEDREAVSIIVRIE